MTTNQTPNADPDALLSLIERVKEHYHTAPPVRPKRWKRRDFSTLSFLMLAVVAVTMRTFRDSELYKLLEKNQRLRQELGFERVPHRTTIGRCLADLVPEAEQQIAMLGDQILEEVKLQADQVKSAPWIDGSTRRRGRSGSRATGRRTWCRSAYATWTPNRSGPREAIAAGFKVTGCCSKGWSSPRRCRSVRLGARTMRTKPSSRWRNWRPAASK